MRSDGCGGRTQVRGWAPWLLAALIGATGCGGCGPAAPGERPPDGEAVDFAQRELVIAVLEQPVAIPVSVGSRPSPASVQSSAPDVVSVAPDGKLVAHRNGVSVLQTRWGSGTTMTVKVQAVEALRLEPAGLSLLPGEEAELRAMGADGQVVSPDAVAWSTDQPDALLVRHGLVKAWRVGAFRVRATYGGAEAIAPVEVKAGALRLSVRPQAPRLKVGEVALLRAGSAQGDVRAAWSTSAPGVLAHAGDGLFEARAAGRAKACAKAMGLEACTDVEVGR